MCLALNIISKTTDYQAHGNRKRVYINVLQQVLQMA